MRCCTTADLPFAKHMGMRRRRSVQQFSLREMELSAQHGKEILSSCTGPAPAGPCSPAYLGSAPMYKILQCLKLKLARQFFVCGRYLAETFVKVGRSEAIFVDNSDQK